eukprot:Colp12_sorted_trinity150504_noHs@10262
MEFPCAGDGNDDPTSTLFAGISRAASRALGFFFKKPIKMFRPVRLSTLSVAHHRIQAQHALGTHTHAVVAGRQRHSHFKALRQSYTNQGAGSVFLDFFPVFAANATCGTILFTTFDELTNEEPTLRLSQMPLVFAAGALGGILQAPISTITDNFRHDLALKMQKGQHTWLGKYMLHTLESGGARALFQNGSITLLRDTLGFALFFSAYEGVRGLAYHSGARPGTVSNAIGVVLAGGAAGVAYQLVNYPLEMAHGLITKMNHGAQSTHPLHDYKRVVMRHGVHVFYKGLGKTLLRAFVPAAVGFFVYEH